MRKYVIFTLKVQKDEDFASNGVIHSLLGFDENAVLLRLLGKPDYLYLLLSLKKDFFLAQNINRYRSFAYNLPNTLENDARSAKDVVFMVP